MGQRTSKRSKVSASPKAKRQNSADKAKEQKAFADQKTIVLTPVNLVKFSVNCSKNFFDWIHGQTYNEVCFQWNELGDGILLDNVWKSSKDGNFFCSPFRFPEFSKAFLLAAADFAALDLSEAESSDDSETVGNFMYDSGSFSVSIHKAYETKTIYVAAGKRFADPKQLGKAIDLGLATDE